MRALVTLNKYQRSTYFWIEIVWITLLYVIEGIENIMGFKIVVFKSAQKIALRALYVVIFYWLIVIVTMK